jgi:hypothetical protein
MTTVLLELIRHKTWATRKLLALCQSLDPALVEEPQGPAIEQQVPGVRRGGPLFRSRSPADVLELTRSLAAERVGVALDQVHVLSMEPTEWSNLSLGCPAPGLRFGEVMIPGYIVQVDAAGVLLTYHTDRGLRAVVCEAPRPVTPDPD